MSKQAKKRLQGRSSGWNPYLLLGAVLLLGAGIRLWAWHQSKASPFYDVPLADSAVYVRLARAHCGEGGGEDAFYYMAPFYSRILSCVLVKPGMVWWAPRFVQALLGVFMCGLMFSIGKMLYGPWEGLAAALLTSLYGPYFFYETHLVPVSWVLFFTTCSLATILATFRGNGSAVWLGLAGVSLGLAATGMPAITAFLPFVLLWWMGVKAIGCTSLLERGAIRSYLPGLLLFTLGFMIPVGMTAVRNHRLTNQWILFSAGGGVTFLAGNSEIAFNELSGILSLPDHEIEAAEEYKWAKLYVEMEIGKQDLTPREVSSFWWQKGLEQWKKRPGRGCLLFLKKLFLCVSAEEIPNLQDMEYEKRFVPMFALPWVSMGWLVPLSLGGVVWRVRRREHTLPILLIVSQCLALGFFYVSGRHRMPMTLGFLPLAGAGLAGLVLMIRKNQWNLLVASLFVMAGGWVVSHSAEAPKSEHRYVFMTHKTAAAMFEQGKYDEAVRLFKEVVDATRDAPNPLALNNLAYAMGMRYDESGEGNLDEAKTIAKNALRLSGGNPMVADTLIWLHLLDYETTEASSLLAVNMMRFPGEHRFWLRWAHLQMLLCDFQAAKNVIRDRLGDAPPDVKKEGNALLVEIIEREKEMGVSPTGGEE